jgi:lipoyl(octanoyl) transferase
MSNGYYGWKIFLGRRAFGPTHEWQKRMVQYRQNGAIRDTLFYVEHPDVFTVGRENPDVDISRIKGVELVRINRGGNITYHGPGQLVVYPIFDLRRRGGDLHKFIADLEEGIIRAFAKHNLSCRRNQGHTGVWVGDRKIASIGIAVSQWISYHGAAINLTTDLSKFTMINPCGLPPEVMTSAEKELGKKVDLADFAGTLSTIYADIFATNFYDVDLEEITEIIRLEEAAQSL